MVNMEGGRQKGSLIVRIVSIFRGRMVKLPHDLVLHIGRLPHTAEHLVDRD